MSIDACPVGRPQPPAVSGRPSSQSCEILDVVERATTDSDDDSELTSASDFSPLLFQMSAGMSPRTPSTNSAERTPKFSSALVDADTSASVSSSQLLTCVTEGYVIDGFRFIPVIVIPPASLDAWRSPADNNRPDTYAGILEHLRSPGHQGLYGITLQRREELTAFIRDKPRKAIGVTLIGDAFTDDDLHKLAAAKSNLFVLRLIRCNRITAVGYSTITSGFPALLHLSMIDMHVTMDRPDELSRLKTLTLERSTMSDEFLKRLGECGDLEELSFEGCVYTPRLGETLRNFATRVQRFQTLDLRNLGPRTHSINIEFLAGASVQKLYLSGTRCSVESLEILGTIDGLEKLHVDGIPYVNLALSEIRNVIDRQAGSTTLKALEISRCHLAEQREEEANVLQNLRQQFPALSITFMAPCTRIRTLPSLASLSTSPFASFSSGQLSLEEKFRTISGASSSDDDSGADDPDPL